jgi:uncharacterized protein (UPF0276 family)
LRHVAERVRIMLDFLERPLIFENSISYSNSKATVRVRPMPERGLLFTITPNPERLLQVR